METGIKLIAYLPAIAVVFVLGVLMPYLTRREIVFTIRVPEDFAGSEEVRNLKRDYVKSYLLIAGPLAILYGISLVYYFNPVWYALALFALLGVMFANMLLYRSRMKDIKKQFAPAEGKRKMSIADTGFRRGKISVSWWWFVPSVATVATAFYMTIVRYAMMPDKIPMHWNIQGEVDRWAAKSYGSALFMPLTMLFMLGLMMFVFHVIRVARQQVTAENPEASIERNRIFRYRWSAFVVVTSFLTLAMLMFAQLQISMVLKISAFVQLAVTGAFTLAILIYTIVLAITSGQGGSRIKLKDGKLDSSKTSRDDDKHWKLGVFYCNPDDPSAWVEKRFGIGWTLNFANPKSYIFLAVILLFVAGSVVAGLLFK